MIFPTGPARAFDVDIFADIVARAMLTMGSPAVIEPGALSTSQAYGDDAGDKQIAAAVNDF